jgi:hypothetical protein
MNPVFDFFSRVLRGALMLAMGAAALLFLISLLLASVVVVAGVSLWALLTGRKPAPVMVFQRFRQSSQRYAQGAWGTRAPFARSGAASSGPAGRGDVVDVQAHEVPDGSPRGHGGAPRSGSDTMSRVM